MSRAKTIHQVESAIEHIERAQHEWKRYLDADADAPTFMDSSVSDAKIAYQYLVDAGNFLQKEHDQWVRDLRAFADREESKFLVDWRNSIHHPGTHKNEVELGISTYVQHLDTADLQREAPSGAVSCFISDRFGRSGWKVRDPDGNLRIVYFHPKGVHTSLIGSNGKQHYEIAQILPGYLDALASLAHRARILLNKSL